jgi:hypothetical protein
MSSTLTRCVQEGKLEKVSAGEVCSINLAKQLGIDNFKKGEYYTNNYANVKTFNVGKDAAEDRSLFQLCTERESTSDAFPLCPLQPGAGFGYTEKVGFDTCITAECPKDFIEDDDDPTKCKKPRIPKTLPLGKKNDERWYDWFTIENYHLGNRYSSSNEGNFAPCKQDMVPYYKKDPVDNDTSGFTEQEPDELDRCISKQSYFEGKYNGTSAYCPLAWVVRAGGTKQDFVNVYDNLYAEIEKKEIPTSDLEALKKNKKDMVKTEILDPINNYKFREAVYIPDNEEFRNACETLHNDPNRIRLAYDICTNLHRDPEKYKLKLMDINGDKPATATQKINIAKQACHATFCDPDNSGALSMIDESQQICFPEAEEMNMEADIAAYEKELAAQEDIGKPITSNPEKNSVKQLIVSESNRAIKYAAAILIALILYYKVWPFIRKFWETTLKPTLSHVFPFSLFISKIHKTAAQLEAAEIAQKIALRSK